MNTLAGFFAALLLAGQDDPVVGEVTSVSAGGATVRVNLGLASGLQVNDGLRIYPPSFLPSEDGRERELAAATVTEVLARDLVAQVTHAPFPLLKGSKVVQGRPVKRGPLPPYVGERVTLDPPEAHWGRVVTVRLNVLDLDGDLARIECTVDGGTLLDPVGTSTRVRWIPPAAEGTMRINVVAVDRRGASTRRSLPLKSRGVAPEARPLRFTVDAEFRPRFLRAADLAADAEGNVYVLDGELRRIVKLLPSSQPGWLSEPCGSDAEYVRLLCDGADALLLDSRGRSVVRVPLGPNLFAASPAATYGGRRPSPGWLRKPVDVAVTPDGGVWVLDAGERTLKRYSRGGAYEGHAGEFRQPVAVRAEGPRLHILDTGAGEILTFEGSRLALRIPFPEGEPPIDFDGSLSLYRTSFGAEALRDATGLRRDGLGRAYVLEEGGRSIARFDGGAGRGRRLGGADLRGAKTVRAARDGGFALEDDKGRWGFDAEGWLVRTDVPSGGPRRDRDAAGNVYALDGELTCNGKPVDLGDFRAADFDVDPWGRVLLLAKGTGDVLRLRVSEWR